MHRYLLAGILVSATAACSPKDAENSRNNAANMGDPSDAGYNAETDLPNVYSCRSTSWAPYTIPATEGGTITVDLICDEFSTETSADIDVELTYPDGEVIHLISVLPLNAGRTSLDIVVPPHATTNGPVSAVLRQVGRHGVLIGEESILRFVMHQTPDEVDANWSDIMAFNPTPPHQNAVIVDTQVGDFDDDGTLEIVAMWRWDKVVGIQTFWGPNRTPGTLKEMPVGVLASAGALEKSHIHIRKRPGGTVKSAYWTGIDPVTKTLRIVIGEITDGVLGANKTFDSATGPFATPEAIIGFEHVNAAGLADDAPAEAFVLYRGKAAGKAVFTTVVTDSQNGKLVQISALDKIGESFPPSHANGTVQVGLMRDFDASSDAGVAVAQGDVYVWTFGKTGAAGEHQILTALLNGGEAGLIEKTILVNGVGPTESGFQAETIDLENDGTGDVVLSSVHTDTLMPMIRKWHITPSRVVGPQAELATTGIKTNASEWGSGNDPTCVLTTNVCHLRTAGPRFFTSAQYPFIKEQAAASGSTESYFVGTTIASEIGFGAAVSTEFAWAPSANVKNQAVVVAPVTLSGSAGSSISDGASVTLGYARNGINLSERELDSEVLIASHTSGVTAHFGVSSLSVSLRSSPAVLRISGPGITGGEISLAGRGEVAGLVKDADSTTHFLFTRNDTKTESGFHVWALTAAGIEGPAQLNVRPGSKFGPTGATSSNFLFTSRCDGNICGKTDHFQITPAVLSTAAQANSVIELGANDIETLGIEAHNSTAVHHRKVAQTFRSWNIGVIGKTPFLTAPMVRRVDVGPSAASGLEELMFVSGMDETDDCPFATVFRTIDTYPDPLTNNATNNATSNTTNNATNNTTNNTTNNATNNTYIRTSTVSESSMNGCWDLHTPVASADFRGVGGQQIITTAVTDTSSRTVWKWEALWWFRNHGDLLATQFGTFTSKPGEEPKVSVTDVNGDGLVDLIIEQPVGVDGKTIPKTIILSDGLGGNLGPAVIPSLDTMPAMPGAADGVGGGQLACGEGLMCSNGQGTKNSASQVSAKPHLL